MSGSPKYSSYTVDDSVQRDLERQRRRQAEEEARRRQEAQERERQQRIQAVRGNLQQQWTQIQQQLTQADIYREDNQRLLPQLEQLKTAIATGNEGQLQTINPQLTQLTTQLQEAVQRKWREEEEKKRRQEIDKQKLAVEELQRSLAQIPTTDAQKFDEAGYHLISPCIQLVKSAIASGNPQNVRAPLQEAQKTVHSHLQKVRERKVQWQQQLTQAESQLGELQEAIVGLEADVVVMRWQGEQVQQMKHLVEEAKRVIATEQFSLVQQLLQQAQQQTQEFIQVANGAQLKADQRDYTERSIQQSLEEMGFTITYRAMEHENHPASAVILHAATNSGKGISVSIPIEGEVYYDVDGYTKQTVATVGGGKAAVCDEAEEVITEMHSVLEEKFGVKMGELWWEDKDPNRQLRQADALPNHQGKSHRRGV